MSPARRPALLYSRSTDDWRVLSPWLRELGITLVPVSDSAPTSVPDRCQFVLLDLDEERSWRTTVQDLRRRAPGTEVVVYTRRDETGLWLDALEVGAFDLLWKPFRREEIACVVASLRRQHRRNPTAA